MFIEETENNVFQIILSDLDENHCNDSAITSRIREAIKEVYNDSRLVVLSMNTARNIIEKFFEKNVLDAFDQLEPYSYKADLLKYCLLYQFGGMTIDLSILPTHKLVIPKNKHIYCFRDAFGHDMSPWALATNLILARPKLEEMRSAINLIVEHCHENYYGSHYLDPTGPGVFGRVLAVADRAKDLEVGEFRSLSGYGAGGLGFVDRHGTIVGIRMKTIGADLTHMGLKGTNNYAELYSSKNIYAGRPIVFEHSNDRLHTKCIKDEEGILIQENVKDIIIFGPYVALNKGNYQATFNFADVRKFSNLLIDVSTKEIGRITIKEYIELTESSLSIEFVLESYSSAVEIRLWCSGGFLGYCKSLVLKKVTRIGMDDFVDQAAISI